jgi:hypothetical protein
VGVEIEGTLPELFKESRLLALRSSADAHASQYVLLQVEGDSTVLQEIIVPYLAAQDQIGSLPASSVAITPANYRFHYLRDVGTGSAMAYVFRITPKKKRCGLIQGELWIDAMTGFGILQSGHFVKTGSDVVSRIMLVRETRFAAGVPFARVTHVTIETRRAGRGELTMVEYRLALDQDDATNGSAGRHAAVKSPAGPLASAH